MKRLFAISAVLVAIFISQRLSAQVDLSSISDGDGFSKVTELFGQPLEREEYEGECGEYLALRYSGFLITFLKPDSLESIYIWTKEISVLSSVVPGGIKVGDNVSKFKDIDFSKEVTGKHYEPAGFIPLPSPFRCHSSENINYNYMILSRADPFNVMFATENGIIREMRVSHPDDAYNPDAEENTEARAISVTL